MENVIRYFESLEQRLATLEAAAKADSALEVTQQATINALLAKVEELEAKIAELEARPVSAAAPEEPEVEVEFVFDESPIDELESIAEVAVEDPVVEEPVVEESIAETAPESVVEPESDPAPMAEPIVEIEPEPTAETESAVASSAVKYGTPVDDIRKAIAIGDRFFFVRELFAGDNEKMQKTLDQINACGSFEEAEKLISKFGWDKESQAYQLFLTPLHRRFE